MTNVRTPKSEENTELQTSLKDATWDPLNVLLTRNKIDNIPFSRDLKVHCYIPVCVGHPGSISAEELAALIENIESKGYEYTICLAPREKLPDEEEEPLVVWNRENAALLSRIPESNVVHENDWRQTPEWKDASDRYAKFREDKTVDKVVEDKVNLDVDKFLSKHKDIAKDTKDAIKKHKINCVIDCLSWMKQKSSQVNFELDTLNVLFYGHDLDQCQRNAFQNAGKMGYVMGSLQYINKISFETTLTIETTLISTLVATLIANASLSPKEEEVVRTLGKSLIDKKTDVLIASKFLTELCFDLGKKTKPTNSYAQMLQSKPADSVRMDADVKAKSPVASSGSSVPSTSKRLKQDVLLIAPGNFGVFGQQGNSISNSVVVTDRLAPVPGSR